MISVKRSVNLNSPVSEVWKLIGGFNALPDWHPLIAKSELEDGGKVRRLTTVDGTVVVEPLLDGTELSYSYTITEGLPVANYDATLRVRPEGHQTVLEWETQFEANGASDAEATAVIEGIFEAGLENLKTIFGG